MKKSLLALAVLGAFAGAAQAQTSSVTIYGIIDTGVVYTSKAVNGTANGTGSKFGVNSAVIQGSRIGFKGVEDLGGGLSAVFNLETGFKNDTGALDDSKTTNTLFRRKSVVGLAGGFGTVLLGRQTDFADSISYLTSVADFGFMTGSVGHNLDRLEGTRSNNSVSYTTNNMGGFTGNLFYGFGEQAGRTSAGQAFGIGGKYDNGPLGLGINYFQSKQGATPADTSLLIGTTNAGDVNNSGNSAAKVLNVAASYQFGPARVYANYNRVKQDLNTASPTALPSKTLGSANKADIYEVGTAYSLTPNLKLLGAVTHTRADFNSSSKGKLTQISLGTDYWLSKRTDLYAFLANIRASDMANSGVYGDATGNAATGGADASQTLVAVGVRHKF
ncbi:MULTISPECIES: porin [Herbaspirillum]|jgi:Outer membrane protein (porin)|uniref:Porin n=2 Tax=Herbaspirillum TaxID=963 RepID=A0A246WQ49_9BURK|nr:MULTISPECIES: porin [Herbaspirillum]MAF02033.1 porin [Herbaspirillum sp.]MCP3656733.1 porin [Herbaspirillum sp.]MCP3950487.1 porin [Herbaspirillum sp.]MCP4031021.1 porin [Herbaspirillum sp.]MDR9851384.1 porin [Herbaspirillum huttiense SE1]